MFNPYEVMYDSVMDVYRYQDKKDDAGFDRRESGGIQRKVPIQHFKPGSRREPGAVPAGGQPALLRVGNGYSGR